MSGTLHLLGAMFLMVAATKTTIVFGHSEGTFLRKKLFVVLGLFDVLLAYVSLSFDVLNAKLMRGLCGLQAAEGLLFLADGLLRERPAKIAKKD
jgi:hypothetical protein